MQAFGVSIISIVSFEDVSVSEMTELLERALKKLRSDGAGPLIRTSMNYLSNVAVSSATATRPRTEAYYRLKHRISNGGRSPKPIDGNFNYSSYSLGSKPTFFGYFDVTPFDESDSRMLAGYQEDETLIVGYFDLTQNVFVDIGETKTWSWQQGCRLQWVSDDTAIFNCLIDGFSGSVLYDVADEEQIKTFSRPVYSVSGQSAFSIDLARLYTMRDGYGYNVSGQKQPKCRKPSDEGLFRLSLETDEPELILSLADLATYKSKAGMNDTFHWINHVFPNTESERVTFLHRWGNGNRWDTRLMMCDFDGSNLSVIEDTGEPSHMTWKAKNRILATVIRSESTEYVVFDADSGEKLTVIDHLEINGHPSYSGDGRLLTDTNPDSDGKRNLSLVDDEKIVPIGTIYSPWMGGDRCDLHPRWNNSGTKVCIDSDHTGTRAMYVFDISARTDENGFES